MNPNISSGYIPNYIGFNVPDGAHDMIDQFNAIIAGNTSVPRTKDLIGEDLYGKAKMTPGELTLEEKDQIREAEAQVKQAQMAQKSQMILLLKKMQQMGTDKLYFGGGGKISPHAMSGYFPFGIDQIIGVINGTGLKSKGFVPNFAKTFYDFDETLGTYPSSVKSAELFQAESALKALPTPLAKSLKGQTIDVMTARAAKSAPYL